jgi:hypothetical protein
MTSASQGPRARPSVDHSQTLPTWSEGLTCGPFLAIDTSQYYIGNLQYEIDMNS